MEESDYTSVVIELENQEEPESQKTYKFDFDDADSPKDYVIDQIFSGDNITVYALFEISEVTNSRSNKQLVEVTDLSVNDDYRFYHKNSYKKGENEKKPNGNIQDTSMTDFDDGLVSAETKRNESLYCLKRFKSNEVSIRKEGSTDLKVLYSKDFISKTSKTKKFKAVSKGVNTDIAQCPKLLEKVHEVMNLKFPLIGAEGKMLEMISASSSAPSDGVIEMDERSSFSSLASEVDCKRNNREPTNFIIVPLLMMDEGKLSRIVKDEKTSTILEEKKYILDADTTPNKMSISINTEIAGLDLQTMDELSGITEEKVKNEKFKPIQSETKITEKQKDLNDVKDEPKRSNEEKILDEIKSLQWKLNALIESLKLKDIELNDRDSFKDCKPSLKSFSNKENTPEEVPVDSEPIRKNQKKFDDLPIFSPVNLMPPSSKNCTLKNRKKPANVVGDTKKVTVNPVVSKSSTSFLSENLSSTAQGFLDKQVAKEEFDWESLMASKGVGASKSDSNNRCIVLVRKYSCFYGLKKSLSFDVKEEKIDGLGIKKVKNTSFKLEASIKAKPDRKIIQNAESPFGDNLTLVKGEMGDEVTKKNKTSKLNLLDFNTNIDKNESEIKENIKDCFDSKSKREEEGDAKLSYQKHTLLNPNITQNTEKVTVQYCSTNTTAPDTLFKTEKTSAPMKPKSRSAEKSAERTSKTTQNTEKPTTLNKSSRKINKEDNVKINETKSSKKLIKIMEKPIKCEKREAMQETVKQKTVSGSRKSSVRGIAESKLHVDRLIKKDDSKVESNSNYKFSQPTKSAEERSVGKSETGARLSRPPSQKREHREPTPAVQHSESKEKKTQISQKSSAVLMQNDSNQLSEKSASVDIKENVEKVMVFESHLDPIANLSRENITQTPLSNPSSVIVELFSKKPAYIDEFYSGVDQKFLSDKNSMEISTDSTSCQKEIDTCKEENLEKPIAKSVWALTKVLLYEDGTKKFEVLEASLTPPGYSLKNDKSPDDKIR